MLRAESSGEAVRWDEVGEEQKSQLDVFLMREEYLPFQTELQHSSRWKPVSSVWILISPLVRLPRPLLCHQHVAPLGAGVSPGPLLLGSGSHTFLALLLSHTCWLPSPGDPRTPLLVSVVALGQAGSVLNKPSCSRANPKTADGKRGRKVRVANTFTNHFGW